MTRMACRENSAVNTGLSINLSCVKAVQINHHESVRIRRSGLEHVARLAGDHYG